MGKPSAPKPPSPQATSAASTATNVGTAIAESQLNNINQVTPDGNLTYSNTGEFSWFDPFTKQTYKIPRTTATQTLSPAQAAIKGQGDAAELNLAGLANQQSGFLKDYMGKPFDGSNEATEARLFELGRKRLDPMFERDREALSNELVNKGIGLESTAWDRAFEQEGQRKNDAYNQLLLTGRGQAFAEGQAVRNQPINEITALLSGSQVSQPNWIAPGDTDLPTTDVAGIMANDYRNRLGIYGDQQKRWDSMAGGLFGLGAALI